jgi:hypothetical protein
MGEQKTTEVTKETGVALDVVTFDEKGEIVGVEEDLLDDVSGGLLAENNTGCNNSANGSC